MLENFWQFIDYIPVLNLPILLLQTCRFKLALLRYWSWAEVARQFLLFIPALRLEGLLLFEAAIVHPDF